MADLQHQGVESNWRGHLRAAAALPAGTLLLLLFLILLPVLALFWIAATSTSDVWAHQVSYVLPRSAGDTLILLVLTGIGTTIIGAGCAWLVSLYSFPGRKFFTWAMVLPLAVPTYIAAYTHVEFFDYSGPVQSTLRSIAGFTTSRDYWFPDIRSIWGAGFIFTMVLYPYVYMTCRLVFSMQGSSVLDVARSLGARQSEIFWRVAMPMARPALAAGVALAAALPELPYACGLNTLALLETDVTGDPLVVRDGRLDVRRVTPSGDDWLADDELADWWQRRRRSVERAADEGS